MIFILDGILGLNLFLAYKFFKNIISPAFLMGAGMMIASIIATLHYEAWRMSDFSFLSVLILGGCPFFFTICCKFFSAFFKPNKITLKHNWTISSINFYALEKIYIVFIVIFLLHLIYTYLSMRDFFSSKTLSELLMARRLDFNSDERLFELPFISIQLSFFLNLITILSIWMFYLIRFYISKKKKQHIRIIYYIVTIILFRFIDGLLTGAKGNILPILF